MTKSQQKFIYFFLALWIICIILLVASTFLDPVTRASMLPVASDGFKTTLGALIGALSAMLGTGRVN